MLKKSKDVLDSQSWCGLNRPTKKQAEVDAVIFGIPFDGGVSYRGGAAQAPEVLRANTKHSTPSTERLYYYDSFELLDAGDFVNEDRDALFAEVQAYVKTLVAQGVKFTMVGGDHSVTIPVERGINDALNEEFGIIHIDAHMDLCDALEGILSSHGNTERRALGWACQAPWKISFYQHPLHQPDEFEFHKANKIQVKTAYDCYHEGIEAVAEACIEKMKRFDKVYITFDIDALDPGFAAGTGTPQFGGPSSAMASTRRKLFEPEHHRF